MNSAISITGMGIVCAIGNDSQQVLHSLRHKESGIGPIRYLQTRHTDIPVGEVKLSTQQMVNMLGISRKEPISRTSAMGALAVREALKEAGIPGLDKKRVALISGTTVGVMDVTEHYFERMKSEAELQHLPHSNECGKSTLEIAEFSGLACASCCTICTACSSALNAIMIGARMLLNDEVDVVIAGGSEPLSRYHLNGFNTLMILDRERCRPFDKSRAGLNLGEGAAFVVLQKDAEHPLAYLCGYANRCDAFHQTATSKDGDGAFLAMSAALKMASLSPRDISYINAHGTGTPDNDSSESAAFRRIFGNDIPAINSTKSYTGHTTSASGSIETVICILAMRNRFIPSSLGWKEEFEGGISPSPGRDDIDLDYVMCNSFGFGGNDSSMILSLNPPKKEQSIRHTESEIHKLNSISISEANDLDPLKEFIPPMERRRMCKLMKASLLVSFQALRKAGLSAPDAIIAATSRGMYELSTQFLDEISRNAEEQLKPTLFMQSTHNTIASAIAIHTGCHGYNITYSQDDDSKFWAERDARELLLRGEVSNVLVCSFDEEVTEGRTTHFCAESTIFTLNDE